MSKINNQTGPPVEGDDFFGRTKDLDFAWKHIKKGNSIILSAPRRVGKSSFAKKLLVKAKDESWNTFEINLEEIKSEIGFVNLFVEKLQSQSWWDEIKTKLKEKLEQLLASIKPSFEYEGAKATLEWQSKKADVYEKLKQLIDHQKDTLIMVDEITILLNSLLEDKENGIQNVTFFLNWLRSFRQISDTKIRWVFCSSIGIDNFTNQHNLSYTFNDVDSFPLGAFNEETSIALLKSLAESDNLKIDDTLINAIMTKIGWLLPYFLQVIHYKLNYLVQVENEALNDKTLDRAYNLLISEKHLNTWDERLKEYGSLESDARTVLKYLCKNTKGEKRSNIIEVLNQKTNDIDKADETTSKLISMLSNDGYLAETNSKYLFRSPLIRDFWFKRFMK